MEHTVLLKNNLSTLKKVIYYVLVDSVPMTFSYIQL